MNKIKKIDKINLLNYQYFLKNNFLKKNKYKLKKILFNNPIIYKKNNLNIIELNNSKNVLIPSTILNFNSINTINTLYENQLLFNYNLNNLNANILYNFNKIMLKYIYIKTDIIKGRVIKIIKTKNNKFLNNKVVIAVLGKLFEIKSINLNRRLKRFFYLKKKVFFKDYNKNKFNIFNQIKKQKEPSYKKIDKKISKFIRTYYGRLLNFKIIKVNKKIKFSRIAYVDEIYKKRKIKQIKKNKKQSISGKVQKTLKTTLSSTLFTKPLVLKKFN